MFYSPNKSIHKQNVDIFGNVVTIPWDMGLIKETVSFGSTDDYSAV